MSHSKKLYFLNRHPRYKKQIALLQIINICMIKVFPKAMQFQVSNRMYIVLFSAAKIEIK